MPTPNPEYLNRLRSLKRLKRKAIARRADASMFDAAENTGDYLVNMCELRKPYLVDKTVVVIGADDGVEAEIFAQYASSVIAYHISAAPGTIQYRNHVKRATRRLQRYANVELREATTSTAAAADFTAKEVDVVFLNNCCKDFIAGQTSKKYLLSEIPTWLAKCNFISGADHHSQHVRRAVKRILGRAAGVTNGCFWWRHA